MNQHHPHTVIIGLGYLGLPLAQVLFEQGHHLTAFKRHFTSDEAALPFAVHAFDFNDENTWQAKNWTVDVPTQADWYILLPPSPFADYPQVVARCLNMALATQARCLVFASSISVYGDAARDCDEHSPVAPETTAARAIVLAENILLNSQLENLAILRLGGLYCAARHPLYHILQQGYLKKANAAANMLHRDLAIAALRHAAAHTVGHAIRNIVQTPHPSRSAFYTQQAQLLGLPVPDFDDKDNTKGKRIFSIYNTES